MAYDSLTTSGISQLVNDYIVAEQSKRVSPIETRKTKYEKIVSSYSTLSSKLDSLLSVLSSLKSNAADSVYYSKKASSSNTDFVSVSSSSSSYDGSYSIRINQLAQNDLALSLDLVSSDASTVITGPGSHDFEIRTGDGAGGEIISRVTLNLVSGDFTGGVISNKDLMTKIQAAIQNDQAIVTSSSVTGSTASSGSFVVDLNGTETTINYSGGTYSDVIDNIVTQLNNISGITAEKVINGSNYQLKVTVNDSSNYISFKSDTGTLLSELGITANVKEQASSGLVTASVFTPVSGSSQLSLTAKNSGYDYRITSLSDTGAGTALASVGLNLGSTRTSFVQNDAGLDTPGFLYTTSQLNAKLAFNGINVERNSNAIDDLVDGSTITLKSTMQATDTTVYVSVNKDVDAIKAKIEEFISSFNNVYTYIKTNSTTDGTTRGVFLGDATASSLMSTLNSYSYQTVSGISTSQINSLSKLGIIFDVNSGLTLSDTTTFESAVENNLSEVITLFTSTGGIATTMYDRINPYLGTTGYIANSTNSYNETITTLSDSIEAAQGRIDKSAEVLRQKYIKLQMQLAQMLTYQNYFSSTSSEY
ncbi:MAG: flagellar filament capping protein FliD [Bacteroidota bacterium]